jgi:hypothetical protein
MPNFYRYTVSQTSCSAFWPKTVLINVFEFVADPFFKFKMPAAIWCILMSPEIHELICFRRFNHPKAWKSIAFTFSRCCIYSFENWPYPSLTVIRYCSRPRPRWFLCLCKWRWWRILWLPTLSFIRLKELSCRMWNVFFAERRDCYKDAVRSE